MDEDGESSCRGCVVHHIWTIYTVHLKASLLPTAPIYYYIKLFSKSNLLIIDRVIFHGLFKGSCSLPPSSGFFSKRFSSPLTVQNRCRCWPAPKILLLNHDSSIPPGLSNAKVENDFNPQQNLCGCQSNLSPKESILFAVLFFFNFQFMPRMYSISH